jgi:hypothetical protein
MSGQEFENKSRDVVVLLVQGKMAGVEQVDFGTRQIALERLRTGSDERGIVPPRLPKPAACAHATMLATPGRKRRFVR